MTLARLRWRVRRWCVEHEGWLLVAGWAAGYALMVLASHLDGGLRPSLASRLIGGGQA